MTITIAGLAFPNTCPPNCRFINDIAEHGQNAVCCRCPVFNCGGSDPILSPSDYRKDWAAEFHAIVVSGEERIPVLRFDQPD